MLLFLYLLTCWYCKSGTKFHHWSYDVQLEIIILGNKCYKKFWSHTVRCICVCLLASGESSAACFMVCQSQYHVLDSTVSYCKLCYDFLFILQAPCCAHEVSACYILCSWW
jgi:hypothetical protein